KKVFRLCTGGMRPTTLSPSNINPVSRVGNASVMCVGSEHARQRPQRLRYLLPERHLAGHLDDTEGIRPAGCAIVVAVDREGLGVRGGLLAPADEGEDEPRRMARQIAAKTAGRIAEAVRML